MNKNIFIKKGFVSVLVFVNLVFCITALSLQAYLHIKYPLVQWSDDIIIAICTILFFISFSFFTLWLMSTHYPNKFVSQLLDAAVITLGVVGCIGLSFLLILSAVYGTINLDYDNEVARDITSFFRLFSVSLIGVSITGLLLTISCFKLKSLIARNYFKSVSEAIHMIGKE